MMAYLVLGDVSLFENIFTNVTILGILFVGIVNEEESYDSIFAPVKELLSISNLIPPGLVKVSEILMYLIFPFIC